MAGANGLSSKSGPTKAKGREPSAAAARISEASELLHSVSQPLLKGLLRGAIERAKQGNSSELDEYLPKARAHVSKNAADAAAGAMARKSAIARLAAGRDPARLRAEFAKLRRSQDADYVKWGQRRPDERTARKAKMSNRLDGRARRMAEVSDMHQAITGDSLL